MSMTDNERLKMIEETVREIENSYYRIYVQACLRSGGESEWTAMKTVRLLFDSDEHLLRIHKLYCVKEET